MVSIEDLKLPPHNLDAERGVLSGILIDNAVMDICDNVWLEIKDFYAKEHQMIFDAMMNLKNSYKTIDIVTVADELAKKDFLDVIWWTNYLYDLSTFLLSISWCGEYCQIVKEKSILRRVLSVCQQMIGDVYDQEDTLTIMDQLEKKIFDLTQTNISNKLIHIKEILWERVEKYMEIIDNPDILNQDKVLSNFSLLDEMLGGFKPGELMILAARPAMGKTALSLNLILNAALDQNKSVAFFSLEMTKELIADRLLSTTSGIPMGKITRGQLDNDDFVKMGEAMEVLGSSHMYIDDAGAASIAQLRSKLRRLKIEAGSLDLVVIDYLQLMNGQGSKFEWNRVQEISQISRGLKELSKELSVPIIALSQLSRNVESRIDKRPHLSDLRESWSIEQDADVVVMIYREEYYDPEDPDKRGVTDLLVRKNRNGAVWEVSLMFNAPTMKFVQAHEQRGGHGE
jgi:replicative DNA helicase